jgi:hypothetical protein
MRSNLIKSFTIFALMAFVLSTYAQGNHYYSNKKLNDPYGKFQISFPGEPTYGVQDVETDMGTVKMYTFMYESSNAVYMASYVDYPADKIAGQDIEAMLKRAAGGYIDALKLESRSQSIINYGTNKGILFYADNGSMYTVMRDYMVKNRLFQVGILQMSAIDIQVENDFFDSFVIK